MCETWMIIFAALFCLAINLPFGHWRSKQQRFSVPWFVMIHAPVPLIIALRLWLKIDWVFIPLFVGISVLGQYFGGKSNNVSNSRNDSP